MKAKSIIAAASLTISLGTVACRTPDQVEGASEVADIAASAPFSLGLGDREPMSIARLRTIAFERCQAPYQEQTIKPVPFLDPPADGGPEEEGLVFQEELAVGSANYLDDHQYYFAARPRAADTKRPLAMYHADAPGGVYTRLTWDQLYRREGPDPKDGRLKPTYEFRYGDPSIVPPIDFTKLLSPEFDQARTLGELVVGHRAPDGGFPLLYSFRSAAYVRFSGYPPMIQGASLRLGAHRIFGQQEARIGDPEDFPVIHAVFTAVRDELHANVLALVESRQFCGALDIDLDAGQPTGMVIDGYWYVREKFEWQKDSHTGLVAFSSMMLRNESQDDTPERTDDEAHDSDFLLVNYAGEPDHGDWHKIGPVPDKPLDIVEWPLDPAQRSLRNPNDWSLLQVDRCPSHYSFFPEQGSLADKDNYDHRASYRVEILESTRPDIPEGGVPDPANTGRNTLHTGVRLYQSQPEGEALDNIVALSNLRDDIPKATHPNQFVRFKYRVTAFFPPMPTDCGSAD